MEANELAEKVESFNRADFMQDNIFKSAQKVENLALSLGRKQMANDVVRLIADTKDIPFADVMRRIIKLCDKEVQR